MENQLYHIAFVKRYMYIHEVIMFEKSIIGVSLRTNDSLDEVLTRTTRIVIS